MAELKSGQQVGPYSIVRKLAEGGMAEIYLATRTGPSGFAKACVLKRIREDFRGKPKFRKLFENEARLAARLEHANVVQIFDLFDSGEGELFLCMQFIDGCSLSALRHRAPKERLPARVAAFVGREVARALTYGQNLPDEHGRPLNLLHRDVSPQNILVSRIGEVKLTDFGIARPAAARTSGGFKGKYAFMAPEQARMDPIDGRTDLFSLGVVLFEMVAGARPFDSDDDMKHMRFMATSTVPPPRADSMGVSVPEQLADIIEGLLQLRIERRTESAEVLSRQLEQFLRASGEGDAQAELVELVNRHADLEAPTPMSPRTAESGEVILVADSRETPVVHGRETGPITKADTPRAISGGAAAPALARPRRPPWLAGAAIAGAGLGFFGVVLFHGVRTGEPRPGDRAADPIGLPLSAPADVAMEPVAHASAPPPTHPPPSAAPSSPHASEPPAPVSPAPEPAPATAAVSTQLPPRADRKVATRERAAAPSSSRARTGSGGADGAGSAAAVPVELATGRSIPFASYLVDGTREGETPATLQLTPGPHQVVFSYGSREQRKSFVVVPGQHLRIEADFAR